MRLMRARKWLLLFASVLALMNHGLYRPYEATKLIRIFELPGWVVEQSVAVGLAYLLIQYACLLWQLGVTYDLESNTRFQSHHDDMIASAEREWVEAMRHSAQLGTALNDAKNRPASDPAEIKVREQEFAQWEQKTEKLGARIDLVRRNTPSKRPLMKEAETAIDLIRTLLPFAIGAWSLSVYAGRVLSG